MSGSSTAMQLSLQLSRMSLRSSSVASSSVALRHLVVVASSSSSSSSSQQRRRALTTSAVLARTHAVKPSIAADTRPITIGTLRPVVPRKAAKRVGRGQGSGYGGESGRGKNGQKSRSGRKLPYVGFAGGQTPLQKHMPKYGERSRNRKVMAIVNLGKIQDWIDQGRLDPSKPITAFDLLNSRCVHNARDGIKLLSMDNHRLVQPINIVVSRASKNAIEQVEARGGRIMTKYYSKAALRYLVKPHKYVGRIPPCDVLPTSREELTYYASKSKRGYLSDRIAPTRKEIEEIRKEARVGLPRLSRAEVAAAKAALAAQSAPADVAPLAAANAIESTL